MRHQLARGRKFQKIIMVIIHMYLLMTHWGMPARMSNLRKKKEQIHLQTQNLKMELINILDASCRENMFLNYFDLEKKLGGKGASENVATQIVAALKVQT